MRLTPHEQERLLIHVAAQTAHARRARGLRLNHPEAIAVLRDWVLELRPRVERDCRPLLHHVKRFGPSQPGAGSVVSTAGARHLCQTVLVGVEAGASRSRVVDGCAAAWLPLAPHAVAVLAMLCELAPELTLTR